MGEGVDVLGSWPENMKCMTRRQKQASGAQSPKFTHICSLCASTLPQMPANAWSFALTQQNDCLLATVMKNTNYHCRHFGYDTIIRT